MADIINSPVELPLPEIPVDSGGIFTPGAAFSIDAIHQIINAAWNLGLDQKTSFEAKVAALQAIVAGFLVDGDYDITAETADVATITEPTVTIPSSIDTAAIIATFDAEVTALIGDLSDKVQYIFDTFFPDDSAQYTSASAWIDSALSNPSGLPQDVRDQMMSDELERITASKVREQDSVIQLFAARRFAMPSGQAASAILQIAQKAQEGIAESSRKITIAGVDRLQWAAEKLIGLRQLAMTEALDYAKIMSAAQNTAASVTGIGYDAQSKLISSVSSYYNARTDAAKTITASKQFNANLAQDAKIKNQAADLALIEDQIKVLMAELAAVAQMATSLFNNIHASAGTNYSVNGT
jgi:hypothetical protein